MELSGEQLRAARAMLQTDQTVIATIAGVSVETIKRLEKFNGPLKAQRETILKVAAALERLGIELIDSGDFSPTGGFGVRMALSREERLRDAFVTILYSYVQRSVTIAWSRTEHDQEQPNVISVGLHAQNLMVDAMNDLIGDVDDLLDGRIVVSEDGYTYRTVEHGFGKPLED